MLMHSASFYQRISDFLGRSISCFSTSEIYPSAVPLLSKVKNLWISTSSSSRGSPTWSDISCDLSEPIKDTDSKPTWREGGQNEEEAERKRRPKGGNLANFRCAISPWLLARSTKRQSTQYFGTVPQHHSQHYRGADPALNEKKWDFVCTDVTWCCSELVFGWYQLRCWTRRSYDEWNLYSMQEFLSVIW